MFNRAEMNEQTKSKLKEKKDAHTLKQIFEEKKGADSIVCELSDQGR